MKIKKEILKRSTKGNLLFLDANMRHKVFMWELFCFRLSLSFEK